MAHYVMSDSDFDGYGVYEYRDDVAAGLGQLPDLSALGQAECIKGLQHVPAGYKASAKQAMQTLVFSPDPAASAQIGGVSGTASYVLATSGGAWVDGMVAAGYVVMVERSPNLASGVVEVMASALPATVVLFTQCPSGKYVILDAHPAALQAAEVYKASGAPPQLPQVPTPPQAPEPTQQCPQGMVGVPPFCISMTDPWPQAPLPQVPLPSTPTPTPSLPPSLPPSGPPPRGQVPSQPLPSGQPEPAPQKAGLPSWVLPVTVGAGVFVVAAAFAVGRSRKRAAPAAPVKPQASQLSPATPNRRRSRRRRR